MFEIALQQNINDCGRQVGESDELEQACEVTQVNEPAMTPVFTNDVAALEVLEPRIYCAGLNWNRLEKTALRVFTLHYRLD